MPNDTNFKEDETLLDLPYRLYLINDSGVSIYSYASSELENMLNNFKWVEEKIDEHNFKLYLKSNSNVFCETLTHESLLQGREWLLEQ